MARKKSIEIYVPEKDRWLVEQAPRLLGEKSVSSAFMKALRIAVEHAKGMSMTEFARTIGYADWDRLMEASEHVASNGDINWWITRLPNGKWAAWDDSKLSPDRIHNTDTREQAIEFIQGGRSNENNC